MKLIQRMFLLFLFSSMLISCWGRSIEPGDVSVSNNLRGAVAEVREIELGGPVAASEAETSGLAWYGDRLILLPQYPQRFAEDGADGAVFYLEKEAILTYLEDTDPAALVPNTMPVYAEGLRAAFSGFEGFESLTFDGSTVYLTVESRPSRGMMGYLVMGKVSVVDGRESLVLDMETAAPIEPQASFSNMTDEAVLVFDGSIFTFYEANGTSVNEQAAAHRFDLGLQPLESYSLTNVPFRLTDVTQANRQGEFWAMNYYYPGDSHLVGDFAQDGFSNLDASERVPAVVERIISLRIKDGEIIAGKQAPISLELMGGDEARNWEGLAQLDSMGFLMITDRYPTTILGYAPIP
ncbi:MAG: hypothetical protein JW750_04715 [Anaerolineaceae bacterium]|nr:hypothetical protein [Anaerolineaceae bacterium]